MTDSDEVAIVNRDRAVTRTWLARRADEVARRLTDTVGRGATVGLWITDGCEFAACVLGARGARVHTFVLLPESSADRVAGLSRLEHSAGVLSDGALLEPSKGWTGRIPFGNGIALARPQPSAMARIIPGETAVHFFTSGTDGLPKGIARTCSSLDLEDQVVGAHLGMRRGTVVLCAVPPSHGYGFTAGLFAPLAHGGRSVLVQPRLAASMADALRTHVPDIVVGVPAQYAAWSALRTPYDGPRPRIWLCGGAPLPIEVRARFERSWGRVISEQYGMTERGAVTVDLEGSATLGKPYPGVTVRIDGPDSVSGVGEVIVTTPYAPTGYLGVEPAPDSPFTADGFRTGDSGWLDDEGRLRLVGRRAHQLNVRGKKVDPVEVERALWSVDGVSDVAVLGIDRASGDQWVAAFVVCADEVSDRDLDHATLQLEPYKRPARVIRVEALPRTPTGTDHARLRGMLG